jgi:hypothetical protein
MLCHYAECHYVKCRVLLMINLNVIRLSTIILSRVLFMILLTVIVLSVIMLSVVAPFKQPKFIPFKDLSQSVASILVYCFSNARSQPLEWSPAVFLLFFNTSFLNNYILGSML